MTLPLRSWLVAVVLIAMAATACSSSDGADTITASDSVDEPEVTVEPAFTDADAEVDEDNAAVDPADENDGTTTTPDTGDGAAVPADDPAAQAAIDALDGDGDGAAAPADADPQQTAIGFVRSRFNIDPDPIMASCIVAQTTTDPALDQALRSPGVADGNIDDEQLKALTFAMNGCVESVSLADWAVQAIGPQGDIRESAPACIAERFDNADRGDVTFYTLAALTYQFRVEPEGVPDVTDMLVTCTPIIGLMDFFANTYETNINFAEIVDRECFSEALTAPEASLTFWSTLIEGLTPPIEIITPLAAECAEGANSGLSETIPDDFEPWSGQGTLAGVVPAARANAYTAPPPMTIDPTKNYQAILATGGGEIVIDLFADSAPLTVNNFVNLANDGYYDGIIFHRVLADFMAQAGDPTGSGSGGPGYQFADETEGGPALDRKGLLAMANSGPATNGSQFFITFVPTDWLTGKHTVFGEVAEGIDIVDAIELRDPSNPTSRGQVIESITIVES